MSNSNRFGFQRRLLSVSALPVLAIGALLLAGCGDRREPTVTDVPKSPEQSHADPAHVHSTSAAAAAEASAPAPSMPPMGTDMNAMARQTLPSGALNQGSGNPDWTVPEGWESVPASSMRRASFRASGSAGDADIAVTSFPGDVGGMLANLNRWRGQLGMAPVNNDTMESAISRVDANGKPVVLAFMENGPQAMYTATYEHAGNSWFVRMAGPTATLQSQREAFVEFVQSVSFENLD